MIREQFGSQLRNHALQDSGKVQTQPGFCTTASAAKTLATENEELLTYLTANAQLLKTLEQEVLHAESLAVQLLQAPQVC